MEKIIVITAPSGAGKSTLKNHLLQTVRHLEFSISHTSRDIRGGEINGKDYWFISPEKFKAKIEKGSFIEYEEVYTDKFYGTSFSEIERIRNNAHHALLDIDVKGAYALKQKFPESKIIFIHPGSDSPVETLTKRIELRNDTTKEEIEKRKARMPFELDFGELLNKHGIFDEMIINRDLDTAKKNIKNLVEGFLSL